MLNLSFFQQNYREFDNLNLYLMFPMVQEQPFPNRQLKSILIDFQSYLISYEIFGNRLDLVKYIRPACFRSSNLSRSGVDFAPLITLVLNMLLNGT